MSIIGPYELPVLWECLSPQKPHGSRFLIHEDLTMVFLMRGRSSSQLQILASEVQMDQSRIWRWAWRGRPPSCWEQSWVCAVCVCVGGVASVMHRENSAVSGSPEVCHGSGPVALSGERGLCVSYLSLGTHHSAPSPRCVALGKLLNLPGLWIPLL